VACGDWLLELSDEPVRAPAPAAPASGRGDRTVVYVAGLVSDCLDQAERAREEFQAYLAELGYRFEILPVSGLSSSGVNATFIRDEMQRRPEFADAEQLIVVGHSKGVIDVLEALVTYPELRTRINAVVSLAGAIGGSPLADIAPDLAMTVVRHTPGLDCRDGDGGALQSLRPRVRRDWLARHPLPAEGTTTRS
jgi:triacylglycerol esterase/lipase EstA (alpha/beta hydrolase family)